MANMKTHILPLFLVSTLTACTSFYVPTLKQVPVSSINFENIGSVVGGQQQAQPAAIYRLSPMHWSDVAKIRAEATRLSYQVAQGKMSKVQAAQYLNRFRVQQVGHNDVDDAVYDVYLRGAVDSQSGAISAEQSKALLVEALKGWQQRWANMTYKPTNPAFTNALMELVKLKPLQ